MGKLLYIVKVFVVCCFGVSCRQAAVWGRCATSHFRFCHFATRSFGLVVLCLLLSLLILGWFYLFVCFLCSPSLSLSLPLPPSLPPRIPSSSFGFFFCTNQNVQCKDWNCCSFMLVLTIYWHVLFIYFHTFSSYVLFYSVVIACLLFVTEKKNKKKPWHRSKPGNLLWLVLVIEVYSSCCNPVKSQSLHCDLVE